MASDEDHSDRPNDLQSVVCACAAGKSRLSAGMVQDLSVVVVQRSFVR